MRRVLARGGLSAGVLAGLVGLVVGIAAVTLDASAEDLVLLASFLLGTGGVSIALAFVAPRLGVLRRVSSLRMKLVIVSLLTATLALSTVVLTSSLMFISTHDLALLVGLITFAFGISVFVAMTSSGPVVAGIVELTQGVRRLSAGDMETRVPVRSEDEVGQLALAFNAMTVQLRESLDRQQGVEQARRELIASVSHDLRTPLASIRAMVESLSDGVVTDEETVARYLRRTVFEVESLGQLINDLFELSQLDSGLLELRWEDAAVDDVISDTLESMSAQAGEKGLRLLGAVDGGPLHVEMDPRRVQRVMANLVQNAIRHTPADGAIDIAACDDGASVRVTVSDTGEGIVADDLPRVFERAYRGDASRARASGGAGLGLAIAKGIVEAHGGRIWATSTVGVGSTFEFTLPRGGLGRASRADN